MPCQPNAFHAKKHIQWTNPSVFVGPMHLLQNRKHALFNVILMVDTPTSHKAEGHSECSIRLVSSKCSFFTSQSLLISKTSVPHQPLVSSSIAHSSLPNRKPTIEQSFRSLAHLSVVLDQSLINHRSIINSSLIILSHH